LPVVQNAFVRAENQAAVRLAHRWRSWRAQVAFRLREADRVNGTQTFLDIPKWSTLEGRVSGRLSRDFRVTLRGYTQTLSDPPASTLLDPRSLYWNGRNFVQLRLEG